MKHAIALLALTLAGSTQADTLRDPFARPAPPPSAATLATEAESEPALQLRAIMVTPGRALANINGQILGVGEWFGNYQLIKIQERSVTLVRGGARSVLALDEAGGK